MTVEDAPEELVWLVEAYLSSGMHREQAYDLVEYLQPRRGTMFLLGDSLTVKLTKASDHNDDHIRINDRTSPLHLNRDHVHEMRGPERIARGRSPKDVAPADLAHSVPQGLTDHVTPNGTH